LSAVCGTFDAREAVERILFNGDCTAIAKTLPAIERMLAQSSRLPVSNDPSVDLLSFTSTTSSFIAIAPLA